MRWARVAEGANWQIAHRKIVAVYLFLTSSHELDTGHQCRRAAALSHNLRNLLLERRGSSAHRGIQQDTNEVLSMGLMVMR